MSPSVIPYVCMYTICRVCVCVPCISFGMTCMASVACVCASVCVQADGPADPRVLAAGGSADAQSGGAKMRPQPGSTGTGDSDSKDTNSDDSKDTEAQTWADKGDQSSLDDHHKEKVAAVWVGSAGAKAGSSNKRVVMVNHTSYLEAQMQPPILSVAEYWHRFKRSDRHKLIRVSLLLLQSSLLSALM